MPADRLRVAALELPARWGQVDAAIGEVRRALEDGPACDLLVLPECALTGYCDERGRCDPTSMAEPIDGSTVTTVSEMARRSHTAILAPLVERDGDAFFNTCFVVGKDGSLLHHYRKRRPWFPERWATRGDKPFGVFELEGVKLTVAICYDVHFLHRDATDALETADVLLFPSAWVDDGPRDLRGPIFRDLAERFSITIVNANWGPGAPLVRGQGTSRIVGPSGEIARIDAPGALRRVEAVIDIEPSPPSRE